jgi:hypothetical protein
MSAYGDKRLFKPYGHNVCYRCECRDGHQAGKLVTASLMMFGKSRDVMAVGWSGWYRIVCPGLNGSKTTLQSRCRFCRVRPTQRIDSSIKWFLQAALYGKAKTKEYGNSEGKVSLSEAQTYLDDEMTYQARTQMGAPPECLRAWF